MDPPSEEVSGVAEVDKTDVPESSMLETLSELCGALHSEIGHEADTHQTDVTLAGDLVRRQAADPAEQLEALRAENQALRRYLRQLLAKPESGKAPIDAEAEKTGPPPGEGASEASREGGCQSDRVESPLQSMELFRRMGIAVQIGDDEPAMASIATEPEAQQEAGPQAPQDSGDEDHKAAMGQYMGQLLGRVRGEPRRGTQASSHRNQASCASTEPRFAQTNSASLDAESPAAASNTAPAVATAPPVPGCNIPADRRAPVSSVVTIRERSALGSMRELANSSANAAINRHARKELARKGRDKLVFSLIATACGVLALFSTWYSEAGTSALWPAAATFVAAFIWGSQAVVLWTIYLIAPLRSRRGSKANPIQHEAPPDG